MASVVLLVTRQCAYTYLVSSNPAKCFSSANASPCLVKTFLVSVIYSERKVYLSMILYAVIDSHISFTCSDVNAIYIPSSACEVIYLDILAISYIILLGMHRLLFSVPSSPQLHGMQ